MTGVVLFDPPLSNNGASLCEQYASALLSKDISSYPFLVLAPLYALIADEWIRLAKYVRREHQTVEFNVEAAHHSVSQCEKYLVHLSTYRRRMSCYLDLTRHQLDSINAYGCKAWPLERATEEMKQRREELKKDFEYITNVLEKLSDRLQDDMNLLLGLRAVFLNRAMTSLAFVGVLFLPFNSVAGILGMSGKYGPGTKNFWVYWACLAPMVFAVWIFHQVYTTAQKPRLGPKHMVGNWMDVSWCYDELNEWSWAMWQTSVTKPVLPSEPVGHV